MAAAAQGVGNGRALSSEGGGEAVGIMTKNEASPLCLNRALKGSRKATGPNFAIIAKSASACKKTKI